VVVRHQDPAAVGGRQNDGGLAGAAEAGGHGDVERLVVSLVQRLVPQPGHILRGGLGGADDRALGLLAEEGLPGQRHAFQKGLIVNRKGHGQNRNADARCFLGQDAAVAVGKNCEWFPHTRLRHTLIIHTLYFTMESNVFQGNSR